MLQIRHAVFPAVKFFARGALVCCQDRCACPSFGMRFLELLLLTCLFVPTNAPAQTNTLPIAREAVVQAEKLIGLDFSNAKIDLALPGLKEQLDNFEAMRRFPLSNGVPPALQFNPLPVGFKFETGRKRFKASPPRSVNLPASRDELAFYSVGELAALLKTRQISSEQLTRFYLDRKSTRLNSSHT